MGPSKMDIAEAIGAIKKMDASKDADRLASGSAVSETTQKILNFLKFGAFVLILISGAIFGVVGFVLYGVLFIYSCFSIGYTENIPALYILGVLGIVVAIVALILIIKLIKKLIKKRKR